MRIRYLVIGTLLVGLFIATYISFVCNKANQTDFELYVAVSAVFTSISGIITIVLVYKTYSEQKKENTRLKQDAEFNRVVSVLYEQLEYASKADDQKIQIFNQKRGDITSALVNDKLQLNKSSFSKAIDNNINFTVFAYRGLDNYIESFYNELDIIEDIIFHNDLPLKQIKHLRKIFIHNYVSARFDSILALKHLRSKIKDENDSLYDKKKLQQRTESLDYILDMVEMEKDLQYYNDTIEKLKLFHADV